MRQTRWMVSGALAAMLVTTAACSDMDDQQQRAVSGGAIGAGGGALFGWLVGGNPLIGALVGGAGGAAVGALTSKDKDKDSSDHAVAHKSNSADAAQAGAEASQLTKSVQSGLTQLGYDPGPADGMLGPKTRAAIREYEGRNKLPVDGQVTQDLWLRIKGDLKET
jgi:osmotically inducible lipoprotein OsmB